MCVEVSGPPAVSVSVVKFACVIVTLVMSTFPVVGLNPLTKSLACGESLMSKAVIFIVAGSLPWVCEIDVDAATAAFVAPVYRMLSASFASVGLRFGARKSGLGLVT